MTAQRELAEEVGLAAGRWHVLVDLFTTPGLLSERLRIYLGPRPERGRRSGGLHPQR